MLKLHAQPILRVAAGSAVAIAFGLSPQFAVAQSPGALIQLASPNNCIESTSSASTECQTKGTGLAGSQDVAVSPDGKNVYVIGSTDDAIAEFARNADGSLTQIGCIADSASTGTCTSAAATGLVGPQAIVVSPDGNNVYVAARDDAGNGTIAEFTRAADGSLTPVSGHACIAENIGTTGTSSPCGSTNQTASGIVSPTALTISPDGQNVYVVDSGGQDIAWFDRSATDGSLSQSGGPDQCIEDQHVASNTECGSTAAGISGVTGVVVSPDGANVYTAGAPFPYSTTGSIAEFTRNTTTGSLTALGCLGIPESPETCSDGTATGVLGVTGLAVSPDGKNVYTAAESEGGPIAEFSRGAGGVLTQLGSPNNCIEEQGQNLGCGSTATGIASGFQLVVSPDGANVYTAAPSGLYCYSFVCADVAEFARSATGPLTQLPSPDGCIQDSSVSGTDCPGNETGTGLGGPGLAISPDGNNLYVTGTDAVAEFVRGTHTLTVSVGGTGSGGVSDGTGSITCPSTCSHAYTANTPVTLAVAPASGSTFTGWSGACSGTGTCQLRMSADMAVTATFTANVTSPPTPGAPTPVLTGAPSVITDFAAGLTGSVNPDGLPTTVYFQYGLDKRYSQVGASGPTYTQQTPAQQIGADFTTHGVGPVSVSGLIPNALYHVRLVATNSAGTAFGQDVTFTTRRAPAPGAPTIGLTFNLAPVSGLVFVLVHGHLVPLTQVEEIPSGTVIDSRHGTFLLISSLGAGGSARDAAARRKIKTQSGQFGGAVVRIRQVTRGRSRGLTTVMMVESAFKGAPVQSVCKAPYPTADGHATRFKISSRIIQLLHAKAHGRFATSGRYSAATVRGTVWTIIARCDGTLVLDIKDSVVVQDFVRHKTIVLHAGQRYLAPGRLKK